MNCLFLPATAATSTRKMAERFMLVGGWGRLLWKRTSRRPDQGRGGDRELLKVDMNSVQVFTLGCFAIHKSSIPSTTPSNMNCQSLSSTSVKSGCMIDKKKPNQTFLKTVIRKLLQTGRIGSKWEALQKKEVNVVPKKEPESVHEVSVVTKRTWKYEVNVVPKRTWMVLLINQLRLQLYV